MSGYFLFFIQNSGKNTNCKSYKLPIKSKRPVVCIIRQTPMVSNGTTARITTRSLLKSVS